MEVSATTHQSYTPQLNNNIYRFNAISSASRALPTNRLTNVFSPNVQIGQSNTTTTPTSLGLWGRLSNSLTQYGGFVQGVNQVVDSQRGVSGLLGRSQDFGQLIVGMVNALDGEQRRISAEALLHTTQGQPTFGIK